VYHSFIFQLKRYFLIGPCAESRLEGLEQKSGTDQDRDSTEVLTLKMSIPS
jgi:hypothetical protein